MIVDDYAAIARAMRELGLDQSLSKEHENPPAPVPATPLKPIFISTTPDIQCVDVQFADLLVFMQNNKLEHQFLSSIQLKYHKTPIE